MFFFQEYQFQNIAPDLAIVDNSVFQGGEQYALVEFIGWCVPQSRAPKLILQGYSVNYYLSES